MRMIINALNTTPHFTCTYGESAWYPPPPSPPTPHKHTQKRTNEENPWITTRGGKKEKQGETKRGDLKRKEKSEVVGLHATVVQRKKTQSLHPPPTLPPKSHLPPPPPHNKIKIKIKNKREGKGLRLSVLSRWLLQNYCKWVWLWMQDICTYGKSAWLPPPQRHARTHAPHPRTHKRTNEEDLWFTRLKTKSDVIGLHATEVQKKIKKIATTKSNKP